VPSGTSLRGLKVRVFPLNRVYEREIELDHSHRADLQAEEGRHGSQMDGLIYS